MGGSKAEKVKRNRSGVHVREVGNGMIVVVTGAGSCLACHLGPGPRI